MMIQWDLSPLWSRYIGWGKMFEKKPQKNVPISCRRISAAGIHNLQKFNSDLTRKQFHSKNHFCEESLLGRLWKNCARITFKESNDNNNKNVSAAHQLNETSFRMSIDIPFGNKIESFITLIRRNLNGWDLFNTKTNNISSFFVLFRAHSLKTTTTTICEEKEFL